MAALMWTGLVGVSAYHLHGNLSAPISRLMPMKSVHSTFNVPGAGAGEIRLEVPQFWQAVRGNSEAGRSPFSTDWIGMDAGLRVLDVRCLVTGSYEHPQQEVGAFGLNAGDPEALTAALNADKSAMRQAATFRADETGWSISREPMEPSGTRLIAASVQPLGMLTLQMDLDQLNDPDLMGLARLILAGSRLTHCDQVMPSAETP